MKIKLQVIIETETPGTGDLIQPPVITQVIELQRVETELTPQTLGLSMAEAKDILAGVQNSLVSQQIEQYLAGKQNCSECGAPFVTKGRHLLVFRTLFGLLKLDSPRFYKCHCQDLSPHKSETGHSPLQPVPISRKRGSFSPLVMLLKERSGPELVYLEAKWASLISYGLTGRLLADFLPVEQSVSKAVLSRQIDKVAERLESELSEEPLDNIPNFPLPWDKQIDVPSPLVVGLDGGYIHARNATKEKGKESTQIQVEIEIKGQTSDNEILSSATSPQTNLAGLADPDEQREVTEQIQILTPEITKATQKGEEKGGNWFEVIVGKSIGSTTGENCPSGKCFGFVNNYTTNSNSQRRVYETLKTQGLQPNQQVIFMSDGGDTVRQVQLYLNPQSESILDWFHLSMRLTVLKQMAKGLETTSKETKGKEQTKARFVEKAENGKVDSYPSAKQVEELLERIKWKLWHGQLFGALQVLKDLISDLESLKEDNLVGRKLLKTAGELNGYLKSNRDYLVNYGERYRNGERISTGFAESTVNQLLSHRFVKKQQMKWSRRGAHMLLQVRIKVVDNDLDKIFCRWYPGLQLRKTAKEEVLELAA